MSADPAVSSPPPRPYPVEAWEPDRREPMILRPVMPAGSRELLGGLWALPTGEIVQPVHASRPDAWQSAVRRP